MPPKVKVTKEDIVQSALEIVRRGGVLALNARNIANALGCSTQPVFSNFASMDELRWAVIAEAYERYLDTIKREVESGKYPEYKAFGMAYICFAKEEKELFRLLFMRDRTGEVLSSSPDFERSAEIISKTVGVSLDTAKLMHLEIWAFVHGIGTMLVTSFLPLDTELISTMLSDAYHGIKKRHTEGAL